MHVQESCSQMQPKLILMAALAGHSSEPQGNIESWRAPLPFEEFHSLEVVSRPQSKVTWLYWQYLNHTFGLLKCASRNKDSPVQGQKKVGLIKKQDMLRSSHAA